MNNNSDFITPILHNYSKFLSLENLEFAYEEMELRNVSNFKVFLASIVCSLPYLGYAWLAINYFYSFIAFLIAIAELNLKSISIVLLLSSIFVIINFLAFMLYKKTYSNLNDYTLSSLKHYLREKFVLNKKREIEKRKIKIIEDTIYLLKDTHCEEELKQRILYKLSVLARDPAIPDDCNFYSQLVSSLSESGLINVSIFDYNDKINTI